MTRPKFIQEFARQTQSTPLSSEAWTVENRSTVSLRNVRKGLFSDPASYPGKTHRSENTRLANVNPVRKTFHTHIPTPQ